MRAANGGTKSILDLRKEAGLKTQRDLLTALGVSPKNAAFGVLIDKGKLPSNHPLIARLAKVLKQPETVVQPLCTGTPLSDKSLRQVATGMQRGMLKRGGHGQRTALVLHRPQPSAVATRPRNSLTRQDFKTRQAARAITDTLNNSIQRGKGFVDVIPVADLALVLNDWYERRGIKEPMVLSPNYAKAFG